MPKRRPAPERFWAKVQKIPGGCWLWLGGRNGDGYGVFWVSEAVGTVYAHRYSFSRRRGRIPRGKLVRHHCDVPHCVRPSHLELGTDSENLCDSYAHGRRKGKRFGALARELAA